MWDCSACYIQSLIHCMNQFNAGWTHVTQFQTRWKVYTSTAKGFISHGWLPVRAVRSLTTSQESSSNKDIIGRSGLDLCMSYRAIFQGSNNNQYMKVEHLKIKRLYCLQDLSKQLGDWIVRWIVRKHISKCLSIQIIRNIWCLSVAATSISSLVTHLIN